MFLKGHSVYCLCICSNCLLSMRSWIVVLEHRKFRSVVIQFCGIILYLINYPFTCLLFRNLYCNVCSKNIVTRPNQIFCQLFMISVESKPYWSDEHAGSVRCTGCWDYSCIITGVGCRVHVEKKTTKVNSKDESERVANNFLCWYYRFVGDHCHLVSNQKLGFF